MHRPTPLDTPWERAGSPTQDQQTAYDLITKAMNAAVARYHNLSDLGRSITVRYDPSVPTADGSNNGTIRFGSNRSHMTERTALHEIAHTIGVGTGAHWKSLSSGGTWHGAQATALVKRFDGSGATLSTGGGHVWPYGLNYENEFSNMAADRQDRGRSPERERHGRGQWSKPMCTWSWWVLSLKNWLAVPPPDNRTGPPTL
ncbi:hypothetical protein [Streptomyces longisporus]|uniref:Uncharacterized protein n=1 Tax=Streptomyces longisporus TaxID=1948 RepID=A0ABP5YWV3_STRLO